MPVHNCPLVLPYPHRMEALDNTHEFLGEVAGAKFRYWVLKMDNQLMIHISHINDNTFNDLAVSMPGGQATTSILGKLSYVQ